MRSTLEKYARRIEDGSVNPVFQCEEKNHGLIFDPSRDEVPLQHLAFGRWYLTEGQAERIETGDREFVLVPIGGQGRVSVNGAGEFDLSRPGGPFHALPDTTNACALYVGRKSSFTVTGRSKMLFFSAPAFNDRPPVHVKPGERTLAPRGHLIWKRLVVDLVRAGKESDNLVVGETYSPPGMWSGTPLHVHDRSDELLSESDHEEVYYFVQRNFSRADEMDPYAVQMMFDGGVLNKSYRLKHRTAVAIPGGCHPVVAGPVSDLLYVWALASDRPSVPLRMRDIRDYAFLKRIGQGIHELLEKRGETPLSAEHFAQLCATQGLSTHREKTVFALYLREYGFKVDMPVQA